MNLRDAVLARIKPSRDEEAKMQALAADLAAEAAKAMGAAGLRGTPTVQGSVAKGTWLRGAADVDLFLLLDPTTPAEQLDTIAGRVGGAILQKTARKYAQHPYVTGTFRGATVDLVPAFQVAEATNKMSAVDRTPFHTRWVLKHLDATARDEARLLKQWLKGVGCYGAQTAIGGFSGYLGEVLVARFATADAVVAWLATGPKQRRIALGADAAPSDAPLVVVDPVDPGRNCAAAVQSEVLDRAARAAREFRAHPSERFYFPAAPRAEAPATLDAALAKATARWVGLIVHPKSDRLDIVFPQFQRAVRTLDAALKEAEFRVVRGDVQAAPDGREILLQWLCDAAPLPAERLHQGPSATIEPNASKFRAKWEGHADASGPVTSSGGRLQVAVRTKHRTPDAWLAAHLPSLALGKHVADSLPGQVLNKPDTVPKAWAPSVADFVLGRDPWQR